jgi:hypothetical protein
MKTHRSMMILGILLAGMSASISFGQVATPPISGAAPGSQQPAPHDTLETSDTPSARSVNPPPMTAPGEAIPQRFPSAEPGPSLGSPPSEPGLGVMPDSPPNPRASDRGPGSEPPGSAGNR